MENVAVLDSGSTIRFRDKLISLFGKKRKEERAGDFSTAKDRFEVSKEYINRKPSLEDALLNAGSIIFIGSPLKSSELEEILYLFTIYNVSNPEEVKLPEQRKMGKWKNYFDRIESENPKVRDFFIIDGDELRLAPEGVLYVRDVLSAYNKSEKSA